MSINWNDINNNDLLIEIEKIENKYLNKFYHFLKFCEDEMIYGFKTKEKIKLNWINYWNQNNGNKKQLSDFNTGAERIVYALLNGKGIGQPNSSPVGADLFFELEDAFIHIDLKTVQIENIGDYNKSIFIGKNQNSYESLINKNVYYKPCLPYFYLINGDYNNKKVCLTYFVTILYNRENLDILNINLLCMPNGKLVRKYKNRPLCRGKKIGEARFNFIKLHKFELLENNPSRIKIIYMDLDKIKDLTYTNKKGKVIQPLEFIKNLYEKQIKSKI